MFDWDFRYAPILAISPAEMTALDELPEKDKDLMLPIFPLRGWVGAHTLDKSIARLKKAIGERSWIADIDNTYVREDKIFLKTNEYPREVFSELLALLNPERGYENWVEFVKASPNVIPVIQLEDISQLERQTEALVGLGRGVVLRLTIEELGSGRKFEIYESLQKISVEDIFVIFDFGAVDVRAMEAVEGIIDEIRTAAKYFEFKVLSVSGSSFPSSFSPYHSGEATIYERRIFNRVVSDFPELKLIYSDRGGARAESFTGGSGAPAPRIDYPVSTEWHFLRWTDDSSVSKEVMYTLLAKEMMAKDYWNVDLSLWGTQMIELTSKGDNFGINGPMKATAVRLNIHMHQQLYYDDPDALADTDEDWVD